MAKKNKPTQDSEVLNPTEPTNNTSIVEPMMKFDGDVKPHKFETYIMNGDQPVVKAIGYTRIPGTSEFVSYIYYIQGDKVLKVVVGEPNLRPIASDEAKVNYVQTFEGMDA